LSAYAERYRVEVRRGTPGATEAEHEVTAIGWRPDGADASLGDADFVTFFRSGCKPFQAVPLVERGHAERFGFGGRELAVMSASHNGAAEHVEVVRRMLARIGLGEDKLLCGIHEPEDPEHAAALRAGRLEPSPVYNNCSGKHAGMLALAVAEGWPVEDYVAFDHPVQVACVGAVAELCGVAARELPWGVDGCSAANPAMPLSAMARGFSRFARARAESAEARERALAALRAAMAEHPTLVAGRGRFCTDLMEATRGEVVAKVGAEGLECLAIARTGEGVAIKVKDGARRAVAPAVVAFLRDRGHLPPVAEAALERWARPVVRNHRGLTVGELRAAKATAPAAVARVP